MLSFGVDVGSVRRKGGFAWAAATADGIVAQGVDDPAALGAAIVSELERCDQLAVAFECPLSVPVPSVRSDDWRHLGRARTGEGNRSWSAGAGTGALATGLVQMAWLFDFVVDRLGPVPTTTQLPKFHQRASRLLIAEALVSGRGKPEPVDGLQDSADAAAAALRLADAVRGSAGERQSNVRCDPRGSLNLAVAAALRAGLDIDPAELGAEVLVAQVMPVTGVSA